jgi:hypothetical protein
VARAGLEHWIKQSHLAALKLALYMALLKDDLPTASHDALLNLINNGHATHNGCPPLLAHDLAIMDCRLTGIVLFSPDLESSREVVPLIAYIPDDPLHPIKHYPSSAAFMHSLVARLRDTDYQGFFSRFVRHEDAGVFFADSISGSATSHGIRIKPAIRCPVGATRRPNAPTCNFAPSGSATTCSPICSR